MACLCCSYFFFGSHLKGAQSTPFSASRKKMKWKYSLWLFAIPHCYGKYLFTKLKFLFDILYVCFIPFHVSQPIYQKHDVSNEIFAIGMALR